MKRVTVIVLIIAATVFFLGAVNQVSAEKKVMFLFVLNVDDQGNVTGVDAINPKTGGFRSIQGTTDPIQGVVGSATLHWLDKDDDPCVVIGGTRYCW
jgi:hypothetical protein